MLKNKVANVLPMELFLYEQVQNSFHDHWLEFYSIWEMSLKTFLET